MGSAGYYVQGEDPPGELLIVNPNAKQLASLMKKGNTVKIEGYRTISADRLFVEKIDGKKYHGVRNLLCNDPQPEWSNSQVMVRSCK